MSADTPQPETAKTNALDDLRAMGQHGANFATMIEETIAIMKEKGVTKLRACTLGFAVRSGPNSDDFGVVEGHSGNPVVMRGLIGAQQDRISAEIVDAFWDKTYGMPPVLAALMAAAGNAEECNCPECVAARTGSGTPTGENPASGE